MIVITGAAGFIGSCLVSKLNEKGHSALILVDDFSIQRKDKNFINKEFRLKIDRDEFISWLDNNNRKINFIYHFGARTDTTEFDTTVFDKLNLHYSKAIWERCVDYNIPLIYASSAATYGMGEHGYSDDHNLAHKLKPLNPYGVSKNDFDKWVLKSEKKPPHWVGLKFFNVYGPNEYHKGRMASVIFHAYNQICNIGKVKLFKSHHPNFEDGKQLRDFIYVKDVIDVCYYLMQQSEHSGIFNLGTGKAQTFLELANALFKSLGKEPALEFIDTPKDIRDKYQYYTEAKMDKLKNIGYLQPFTSLEKGIADYVNNYLINRNYF